MKQFWTIISGFLMTFNLSSATELTDFESILQRTPTAEASLSLYTLKTGVDTTKQEAFSTLHNTRIGESHASDIQKTSDAELPELVYLETHVQQLFKDFQDGDLRLRRDFCPRFLAR